MSLVVNLGMSTIRKKAARISDKKTRTVVLLFSQLLGALPTKIKKLTYDLIKK